MTALLRLDGRSLTLDQLAPVYAGQALAIELPEAARAAVRASRALVDQHVAAGDVIYGLTTGFGKLKNVAIAREDLQALQQNLVLSHCCGVGDEMPANEV